MGQESGHGLAGSSASGSQEATFKVWTPRLQSHLKLDWRSIFFQVLMVIGNIQFLKGCQTESLWLCQVDLSHMASYLLKAHKRENP